MRGRSTSNILCLTIILFGLFSSLFWPQKAVATINRQINFQGKLTNPDGTNVSDGSRTMVFSIYTVSSGGAAVWTESKSVSTVDGIFQTALGDTTTLPGSVDFNGSSLYLGVTVAADAEMTPRIRLTAAPYAFNADLIDGLDSVALGQLASTQTWTGTNTLQPTTNISALVIKQTSFGSPTADIFNVQTANATNIIQIAGPTANEAAVTITSVGASRDLTLDSASGNLILGSNTTAIKKIATAFSLDINNGSNSTLTITNSGAGVGSLDVEGNITTTATIGSAGSTTFTGNGATFSGVVNADGGIAFDAATDTIGAFTQAGNIDASTNIITNIGNGGTDFVASTGALTLAGVLTANGGISLAANQDITLASGTGTMTLNSTVTNASETALQINPSHTGGASDGLTYNNIAIADSSPTNAAGTDNFNGLLFGNLTDPGATITSTALNLGTGWDRELNFDDATPEIRLNATDNSAILSITDVSANNLIRIQDHSTNFGASVEAGAFIDYNSMYNDEFFKDRTQVVADGNQNWGDNLEWTTGETGACTWDGLNDTINGVTSIVATTTADFCNLYHSDLAASTSSLWLDADNLPTIVMKVRPSVAGAGVPDTDHQFFAGISTDAAGEAVVASGGPASGIYFSNASNAAGTTGTANWFAVTDNAGAATNTACGVAVDETNFALLIIKVMSTALVKFYIDSNVSDGISLVECGTGNTANINTTGMSGFFKADWDANSNASTLDIDFFRVWQDDAAQGRATPSINQIATSFGGQLATNQQDSTVNRINSTVSPLPSNYFSSSRLNNTQISLIILSLLGVANLAWQRRKLAIQQQQINRLTKIVRYRSRQPKHFEIYRR